MNFATISSSLSALSPWLPKALILSFLAVAGGLLVYFGLSLEKKSEKPWFLNADDFRSGESEKERGWFWLMWGIRVEIFTALVLALTSVWDEIKTAKAIANADPLNQPISDISAVVTIKLEGTNFVESPQWGAPWLASLVLCDLKDIDGKVIDGATDLDGGWLLATKETVHPVDYSFLTVPKENAHGYVFNFFPNRRFITKTPVIRNTPQKVRKIITDCFMLKIDAKFIPHDAELLGGDAEIIINGGIRMDFDILPQSAVPSPFGLSTNFNSLGFSFIATNGTLKAIPKWMQ